MKSKLTLHVLNRAHKLYTYKFDVVFCFLNKEFTDCTYSSQRTRKSEVNVEDNFMLLEYCENYMKLCLSRWRQKEN